MYFRWENLLSFSILFNQQFEDIISKIYLLELTFVRGFFRNSRTLLTNFHITVNVHNIIQYNMCLQTSIGEVCK